jgi:signal peptidase I
MIGATRSKAMVTAAAVGVALAAVVVIRTQFLDTASVSSDSMAPTVCTGDTVLLARLHGGETKAVAVGDIVTFPSPQDGAPTIKRVVAVGGQRVAIRDAELVVDEQVVDEPYVDHASIDGVYFGPVTVPVGSVFVMGDHRETSIDSRAYGPIRTADIEGRLLLRIGPSCQR